MVLRLLSHNARKDARRTTSFIIPTSVDVTSVCDFLTTYGKTSTQNEQTCDHSDCNEMKKDGVLTKTIRNGTSE